MTALMSAAAWVMPDLMLGLAKLFSSELASG